jgi:hypothetical protein
MERRAAIKPVQEPPRFQEGFLREVLRLLVVAFIPVEDCKDLGLVPPDDFREFVRCPIPDPVQQFGIVVHRRSPQTGRDGFIRLGAGQTK